MILFTHFGYTFLSFTFASYNYGWRYNARGWSRQIAFWRLNYFYARNVLQSFLQFGICAGFLIRKLSLFILSFGSEFLRVGQQLAEEGPMLSMGEPALLLYFLGRVGMLQPIQ
jgi:hypothetical protein